MPLTRWRNAFWVNGLAEKYAWLSIWTAQASDSGLKAAPVDHRGKALKPNSAEDCTMSCLSVLEFWEDGGKLIRDVASNTLNFPKAFATGNPWNHRTHAYSLMMLGMSSPEL